MFQLLSILFLISIPVFYIYGIIQALSKNKNEQLLRQKIIKELLAGSQESSQEKERTALQIAAEYLRSKAQLPIVSIDSPSSLPIVVTSNNEKAQIESTEPVELTVKNNLPTNSTESPFHSLENINILLYLGAFLVIVACGIFANYSYASLDGFMKTVLMGVFSAVFYLVGLLMYQRLPKVRPASIVFTAIGLIAFPLVGLVAYNFWLSPTSWRLIWFFTSLGCILLYFVAYRLIKHSLLEYLTLFTALSLFQSVVGLFELPIHFYYWGFSIFAIVSLVVEKVLFKTKPTSALHLISQFTLPLSIFLSVGDAFIKDSFMQSTITLSLATVFYVLLAFITEDDKKRLLYKGLSALCFPLGIILFWLESLPNLFQIQVGVSLFVVSLMYTVISEMYALKKQVEDQNVFANLSGLLIVSSVGLTLQHHTPNLLLALIGLGFLTFLLYRVRTQLIFLFFSFVLFALPYTISQLMPILKEDYFVGLLYLGTLLGFIGIRKMTITLPEGRSLHLLGYGASFIVSFLFAIGSNQIENIAILTLISVVLFCITFLEKIDTLTFLPYTIVYFILSRISDLYGLTPMQQGLLFIAAGCTFYALSYIAKPERRTQLILVGIAGPFLSMAINQSSVRNTWLFSGSGIIGGILICIEGLRQKTIHILQFGVAVVLGSVQLFLLDSLKIKELQIYTLSWSAYILWLSRYAKEKELDLYYLLALAVATVPLGVEALENQLRGLILIGEGLGLVLVGIQLRKKIIWQWGAGVLVIEVLYYMREFLLNLPTWAIFGGLGLAILGGSVYLLQRRQQS